MRPDMSRERKYWPTPELKGLKVFEKMFDIHGFGEQHKAHFFGWILYFRGVQRGQQLVCNKYCLHFLSACYV